MLNKIGFSLFLYGFYWALRVFSWIPSFKAFLKEKDFCMDMRSEDGIGRIFVFNQGRVRSLGVAGLKADFSMVWQSSEIGLQVMLNVARGDKKALTNAVMKGMVKLIGDAGLVTRFMEITNRMEKMVGMGKKKK